MKVDLVYKIGKRDNDTNTELRHSIRSAVENFTDLGKIYIVGHKPEWAINVIHIPMGDPYKNNKDANLINKLLRACQEEDLSQEFLNMSDDYFFLEKIGKDYFDVPIYDNEIIEKPNPEGRYTKWDRRLLSTKQILKERGYEQNIYDLHMPVLIDKTKYKQVMLEYDYGFDNGYCGNTLYFNTIGKKGREVIKNKTKEELEEKKRQQMFQNSLNHFTETEEAINDEELRQKYPANIEGSKEFNKANDSFDEIILEQEANQYWEINKQIKKLEEERNEIIDNVQIQINRNRFDEINEQLVDLYEQRRTIEQNNQAIECKPDGSINTLNSEDYSNRVEGWDGKEFPDFFFWASKQKFKPFNNYTLEEYNQSKAIFEKSKLSNGETRAQSFKSFDKWWEENSIILDKKEDAINMKLYNQEKAEFEIQNEIKRLWFQNIKIRRLYINEGNCGSEDSRLQRRAIEFTLNNEQGQEVKIVKSLEELEKADREGITHVEERFREWLLNKDKENVDYQLFNDISRLTKPLKSVKEIQEFTANSLTFNYTVNSFNQNMENFLSLRFNKLCSFESK